MLTGVGIILKLWIMWDMIRLNGEAVYHLWLGTRRSSACEDSWVMDEGSVSLFQYCCYFDRMRNKNIGLGVTLQIQRREQIDHTWQLDSQQIRFPPRYTLLLRRQRGRERT